MTSRPKLGLTGAPRSGKTTTCLKLIGGVPEMSIRGFVTEEVLVDGDRTGFVMRDLSSGETRQLASIDHDGPRVGSYGVIVDSVDLAIQSLTDVDDADLVIVDEVAPMEWKHPGFAPCIMALLERDVPMLLTFKKDSGHRLIRDLRAAVDEVYEVTVRSRAGLVNTIRSTLGC